MRFFLLFVLILLIFSCKQEVSVFEPLFFPSDNPINGDIAAFGEKLFFDVRLSRDNTVSCATCHKPEFAFADTVSISAGVGNRKGFRNAPTLLNVAYKPSLMLDGAVPNLEMQAIVPIQDHNEMAITMGELVLKLRSIQEYQELSAQLFDREIDAFVITRALANYERTLISGHSRFDSFYYFKRVGAINSNEARGWQLFQNKACIACHALPHFTNHLPEISGLPLDSSDLGRFRITVDSNDIGKFIVPTLRNITKTGPYSHNGSYRSLHLLIDDHTGNTLNRGEIDLIVAFLHSLEDQK